MADLKKLPGNYFIAAELLKKMSAKKGSLNSLISELNPNINIKLIYALVIKTIQNLKTIQQMMETMAEETNENVFQDSDLNPFLTQILIADLMFGKRLANIKHLPKITQLIGFEDKFKRIIENNSDTINSDHKLIVRYIRINLIKTNLNKIIKKLIKNGFKKLDYNKESITFDEFKELVINLKEDQFIIDYDFQNDLLAFNIKATKRLQEMKSFKESKIVMQDKASLIPVECLELVPGMTVMDICCAPGMKTTAIASRIKNSGTIFAFDKSVDRINQMKNNIEENGVNCCQINCKDFTVVSPQEFQTIDAILLDPSCSGSGMNKRVDYMESGENKGRLLKLASFQTKMLSHAMSFGAKRIVYSTCSLSLIENENVVKSALKESEFSQNYEVVNALPDWPIRGVGDYPFASKCIRSDAKTTLTNGFFVCVLQKIDFQSNKQKRHSNKSIKRKVKRQKLSQSYT